MSEGFSYYIPLRYSEPSGYYRNCIKSLDVAMFQVALRTSTAGSISVPAAPPEGCVRVRQDRHREVNKNMPVCLGGFENCIHIDDVDMIVRKENLL